MVRPQYSNYPSVAVFIPCYNESADLVLETVLGAVAIDYPSELLNVYLCDDGKDNMKRNMIAQLRSQYQNIYYVTRPDNSHAKAGNLNYAIERTRSDLIVTLDADFVARPNILQRLVPYYYVWNAQTELYEFNDSLAVVQTPQHYRNLSPYDSDPLDQRSTFFFECVQPGKCYWNASTMIGTTNLINRVPLTEAGLYPYHSITEDTAMSLVFHSLGFRTFFVNESLATGLACTSMWSNLGQRARWLKGDYQILFNFAKGPYTAKGLTLIQRLLYIHMTYSRLISVTHFIYDIALILLLVFRVSPLDAVNPVKFIIFLGVYLLTGILARIIICSGGTGLDKSESGAVAFEAIFRYTTIKGIFVTLFMGQNLKFKVTEKQNTRQSRRSSVLSQRRNSTDGANPDDMRESYVSISINPSSPAASVDMDDNMNVPDAPTRLSMSEVPLPVAVEFGDDGAPAEEARLARLNSGHVDGIRTRRLSSTSRMSEELRMRRVSSVTNFHEELRGHSSDEDEDATTSDEDERGDMSEEDIVRKSYFKQSQEERASHHQNVRKNLKRIWFNILSCIVLLFAIIWAFIYPPLEMLGKKPSLPKNVSDSSRESALLQIAMAIGFGLMNLLPHFIAIYLSFIPYTLEWEMPDLVHGRCDQYAQHPRTGRLFVPWSFISLLTVAKTLIMIGSIAALAYFVFATNSVQLGL
nr:cellulose synthase 4 [Calliarthron tuberculosum]